MKNKINNIYQTMSREASPSLGVGKGEAAMSREASPSLGGGKGEATMSREASPSLGVGKGEAILSSTFFGPIQWYQKLNRSKECWIEAHDNFIKQTYRNRCLIATTAGVQALTVPIERFAEAKCEMQRVRVSNHNHWRHLHWNALCSAYGESPFFEFYEDDLRPFFEKEIPLLFDLNLMAMEKMCELLDIHPRYHITSSYGEVSISEEEIGPDFEIKDYRDAIRPKHPLPDPDFTPRAYHQVYEQKHGFLPNLSILDLLFNMGPEAILYL